MLRFSIALFCMMLFLTAARSQTKQDSLDLRKAMDSYRNASLKLDVDSLLHSIPPTLFTLISYEELKSVLAASFNNEVLEMSITSLDYRSVMPLVSIDSMLCTLVSYDAKIVMNLKETDDEDVYPLMIDYMKRKYGEDGVVIDPDNPGKITIDSNGKKMFALKDADWDSWKFMEDKRESEEVQERTLMKMVIPEAVLNHFE
ncbi:MAG: hypothetical protein KDC65_03925 [Saprospiraceae bacterium]|nr:hypothetical protein [Saprospiraceae bacterium]